MPEQRVIFNCDASQTIKAKNCSIDGFYGFVTEGGNRGFVMHDKVHSWIAILIASLHDQSYFCRFSGVLKDMLWQLDAKSAKVYRFSTKSELFAWLSKGV